MRRISAGLVILSFLSGCTNSQLRQSTVNQAGTVADVQHQQTLQNLAAFACNRNAIPSHVNLHDGTAQITDNGSLVGQVINNRFLTMGAQRTIVDQWSMTPITNDVTLRLLQVAYRNAFGAHESLYQGGLANDLAQELKKQTYQVDDLRTTNANTEMKPRSLVDLILGREPKPSTVDSPVTSQRMQQTSTGPTVPVTVGDEKTTPVPGIDEKAADVARWSFESIISSNSPEIVLDSEISIVKENLAVVPTGRADVKGRPIYRKATPLVIELRRQVMETGEDIAKVPNGWLGVSHSKRDVPKQACYVAAHKNCKCGCYVWVLPSSRGAFEDFTLKIMKLSTLIKEPTISGSAGVKFTPSANSGFSGTAR